MMGNVSGDLASYYASYYSDLGPTERKRELAARDSVAHIRSLMSESLGCVVDVGAGNGAVIGELARQDMYKEISALEISASGLEAIHQRDFPGMTEIKQFDGYSIPFGDREFDTAICVHVLEHVEHERLFLREIGRIANKVFIEIPLEGGARGTVNRTFGHINYYSPKLFLNLLETSGLKPISWEVTMSSRALEVHTYGRFKGTLRAIMRRVLLRLLGQNLAPELVTYLMAVVCEPDDGELDQKN
jgi:ubiquinone/menaquinone biosynthesis C-methylase UbiE